MAASVASLWFLLVLHGFWVPIWTNHQGTILLFILWGLDFRSDTIFEVSALTGLVSPMLG